MPYPMPENEAARLSFLHDLGLGHAQPLDAQPVEEIQALCEVAAGIAGTEIALVSLIGEDEQAFIANTGLDGWRGTPRDEAICAHTIMQSGHMTIEDASKDARFADFGLVTGTPAIRFYSGYTLEPAAEMRIGALCVADRRAMTLSAETKAQLERIGRAIATLLLVNRDKLHLTRALAQAVRQADEIAELAASARHADERRLEAERARGERERETSRLKLELEAKEEKMSLHRKFVSMVSHEFRTPLSIIDGHARSVGRKAEEITPPDLRGRMLSIRTGVQRLLQIIESVLSSSRLAAGVIQPQPEYHNLQRLVQEVCADLASFQESHRIEVDASACPVSFYGDPALLRQALSNLLANAIKYSPDASRVEVSSRITASGFAISVRDYGLGIPEDEIPGITTAFFRASTSAGIAGTGIGLNLVKSFMEMHGGQLEVSSVVGKGSIFTLHFANRSVCQLEIAGDGI